MPEVARWELLVKRDDLAVTRISPAAEPELGADEVELAVERLALTMNNVTYARWGDIPPLNFWNAFPAPDPAWGRVPVWGFVRVSRSNHPEIPVGTRFFGYLPSSSHHVVRPQPASRGFVDTTAGRYFAHPWYQTFQPAGAADDRDDRRTLLRPIYPASFHVADFLAGKAGSVDGETLTVLLTSASSKVAIGIAHRLSGNPAVRTVGLTSAHRAEFVANLGYYDDVADYDTVPALPAGGPTACVDLAGDGKVLSTVYERFGGNLVHTALLGWTHPNAMQPPPQLPDPAPELFFTPAVEGATIAAEGAEAFFARYHKAEDELIDATRSWLTVDRRTGPQALAEVFHALLDGTHAPDTCTILLP